MEGLLSFPRLNLLGVVSFLVDTGADTSIIGPPDAVRIGVQEDQLTGKAESFGIGGKLSCSVEPAVLIFRDDSGAAHFYSRTVQIMPLRRRDLAALPSLLGRDVLDHWRVTYDPQASLLEIDIHSADQTLEPPAIR